MEKRRIQDLFRPILPDGIRPDVISMSTIMQDYQKRQKAYRDTIQYISEIQGRIAAKNFAIEPFEIESENGERYRISILNPNSLRTGAPLLFGSLNPCCLSINGSGDLYLRKAFEDANVSFIIIEGLREGQSEFEEFGRNAIFGEALCWLSSDRGTLVIDTLDLVQKRDRGGANLEKLEGQPLFYLSNNTVRFIIEQFSNRFIEQNPSVQSINMGIGGLTLISIAAEENRAKAIELQNLIQRLENLAARKISENPGIETIVLEPLESSFELVCTMKNPPSSRVRIEDADVQELAPQVSEVSRAIGFPITETKVSGDLGLFNPIVDKEGKVAHTSNSLVQVKVKERSR